MAEGLAARRRRGRRVRQPEREALQELLDRVQTADYVIPTGAGSIVGRISTIKTQQEADDVLRTMLDRVSATK